MESSSLGGEGARGGGACRVCGDKASGKHYGVASCDGCRGFFKRSIRRNLDYVCKDNNECVVDVTRRNQCQACRFSKCLRVNMRKDAVQHERAPRSGLQSQLALKLGYAGRHFPAPAPYLPPFRLPELDAFHVGPLAHPYRLPLFSAPLHYPLGAPGYFPANVFYPSPLPALHRAFPVAGVMERGAIPESSRERSPEGSLNAEGSGKLEEEEVTSSEEAFNTLTAGAAARKGRPSLLRRESPVAPVITVADYQKPSPAKMPRFESAETERQKSQLPRPELSRPANDRDLSCMLGQRVNEYAAKVLLISVQWSRSLPSFLQLSQRDQETLLLSSWKELFILTAAHYSVHLDEEQFTSQLMGNRPDLREEARGLAALVSRVVRMRLDHTEYTCLKAMVLFRSESLQSGVSTVVEFLQEQSLGTLQKHCASHPTGARFGRLLLLLPAVSCLASQAGLQRLIFTSTLADVETVLSRLMRAPNN